jgi:hypothetical protein
MALPIRQGFLKLLAALNRLFRGPTGRGWQRSTRRADDLDRK